MIRHLSIKNFAIIENAAIDFHDGLNIITGETGAGKSIVIEAVSLALGSRADTAFIRSGEKKAVIQMIAELKGEEYIITREISSSGKNICRINDEIVTLSHLSSLCKKLADIHGQYDHQSLLNAEYHINLVDMYHKDLILPAKDEVLNAYNEYARLRSQLKALMADAARDKRQRDFMQFELEELQAAKLVVGEDKALDEQISLLRNSEKIYENLAGAYQMASDDETSVLYMLKHISDLVGETASYSQKLLELSKRLNEIYYDFEDTASDIRSCRDEAVFSPEELDSAIARLENINRLKTKYDKSVAQLLEYEQELEQRLSSIENADHTKTIMEKELTMKRKKLIDACCTLSHLRKEAAKSLEKKITAQLKELNFTNAEFSIEFRTSEVLTSNGSDTVEFLISTNKGESLKPLSKIASGGEMSRIMLAFKKVIGDYDEIPTMIFDEIDAGISGIAASVVGHKLKEISDSHQIICITHLPQIAAFGSHNYKISKCSDDSMTYTTVTPLSEEEKTMEIARLLGGANITETTLKSAHELIAASK